MDDRLEVPESFAVATTADFEVDLSDSTPTVRGRGEVDVLTAPFLWASLEEAIGAEGATVVFDMAAVDFIDSMGLGVLVRAHKRLSQAGRRLSLRSPNPQARQVLELTGLVKVLTVTA